MYQFKHVFRTVSMRQFFWVPTTYVLVRRPTDIVQSVCLPGFHLHENGLPDFHQTLQERSKLHVYSCAYHSDFQHFEVWQNYSPVDMLNLSNKCIKVWQHHQWSVAGLHCTHRQVFHVIDFLAELWPLMSWIFQYLSAQQGHEAVETRMSPFDLE